VEGTHAVRRLELGHLVHRVVGGAVVLVELGAQLLDELVGRVDDR